MEVPSEFRLNSSVDRQYYSSFAPIVLGLLWLRTTNPTINWETLSLAFPSGTASMLPHMTVAMACTMIDLPTIFDTIPELYTALMAPPSSVPGPLSLP